MIGYPTPEQEQAIIRQQVAPGGGKKVSPVASSSDILKARALIREVYMDEKIERYIVSLVYATRTPENYGLGHLKPLIGFGASPRASIGLALAAKAHAFMNRRGFVIPEDVRAVAMDVMRHRIGLTFEAEAEEIRQEQIVTEILDQIEVP